MGENADSYLEQVAFTDEQRARVEQLYSAIVSAVDKTKSDGALDVPLVVMPFAAILGSIFGLVEANGGESVEYLTIAFAKLVKQNADIQKAAIESGTGHA